MASPRRVNEDEVINDEITYAPGTVVLEDCMTRPRLLIQGVLETMLSIVQLDRS